MPVCEGCGAEVYAKEGTARYEPVDPKLRGINRADGIEVPFRCEICGAIKFRYQAVRDVVFLYPLPKKERTEGGIYLPDEKYVGGSYIDRISPPLAVVLSCGKGYWTKKGKFVPSSGIGVGDVVYYSRKVPWRLWMDGVDGKKHAVIYCGYQDVYAQEDTTLTHGEEKNGI